MLEPCLEKATVTTINHNSEKPVNDLENSNNMTNNFCRLLYKAVLE